MIGVATFNGLLSSEQMGDSRDCRPCCSAKCSAPCEPAAPVTSLEAPAGGGCGAPLPPFAFFAPITAPAAAPCAQALGREGSSAAQHTNAELASTLSEAFELKPGGGDSGLTAFVWCRDGDGDAERDDESCRASCVWCRVGDGDGEVPGCAELLRLGMPLGPRCRKRRARLCSLKFSLHAHVRVVRVARTRSCV